MDPLEELNAGYIRSVVTSDVKWFEEHLAECGNCEIYLEQIRSTMTDPGADSVRRLH